MQHIHMQNAAMSKSVLQTVMQVDRDQINRTSRSACDLTADEISAQKTKHLLRYSRNMASISVHSRFVSSVICSC